MYEAESERVKGREQTPQATSASGRLLVMWRGRKVPTTPPKCKVRHVLAASLPTRIATWISSITFVTVSRGKVPSSPSLLPPCQANLVGERGRGGVGENLHRPPGHQPYSLGRTRRLPANLPRRIVGEFLLQQHGPTIGHGIGGSKRPGALDCSRPPGQLPGSRWSCRRRLLKSAAQGADVGCCKKSSSHSCWSAVHASPPVPSTTSRYLGLVILGVLCSHCPHRVYTVWVSCKARDLQYYHLSRRRPAGRNPARLPCFPR